MADLINVRGLSDLQKLLNTLPAKIEANVMRGALREGAKVVLAEAKANVPVNTGTLKDGLKISTGIKRGVVTAKIKATGKHAHLAPWIEFGTRSHAIKVREDDKALNRKLSVKRGKLVRVSMTAVNRSLRLGGIFRDVVMHPGTPSRPFMRPALDGRAGEALKAMGEYIKKRLASKHGIDTADITIGEDDER
jgi:HK97 gp10 family phage protein